MSKKFFRLVSAVTVLVLSSSLMSACGNKNNTSKNTQTPPVMEGGPLTKYDPGITVSVSRVVDQTAQFETGKSLENNAWADAMKSQLGITLDYKFTAASIDQYAQKLNIAITAGDLPDVFPIENISKYSNSFMLLKNSGLLEDMTPYFNKYASPALKASVYGQGNGPANALSVNGKLMAIPEVGSAEDATQFLYVKTDWLKRLNLQVPKSIEDVIAVAKAFANQDPDGNGKKDTYGLALTGNLFDPFGSVQGFFNAYGAYPQDWVKNSKGQIVYGSIQPECKEALLALQDLYKAGAIDPEFGIKNQNKLIESFAQGKVGINYGVGWNPSSPLYEDVKVNKNADWDSYAIVGKGGKVAKPEASITMNRAFVVRKGAKHPEAIIKLMNFYLERGFGKDMQRATLFDVYDSSGKTITPIKYSLVNPVVASKNVIAYDQVMSALKKGSPNGIVAPYNIVAYNDVLAYQAGNRAKFANAKTFGVNSTGTIKRYYLDNKLMQFNVMVGIPSDTYMQKGATLNDLVLKTYLKIILGADISEFDKLVKDWNSLGGDVATKEMNSIYNKK